MQLFRRNAPHAPEAAIIRGKARIRVARAFTLARADPTLVRAGFPAAPADHALHVLARRGRTVRVSGRAFFVVIGAEHILAPFRDIAVKVADPEPIRFLLTHGVCFLIRILTHPAVLPEPINLSEIVRPLGPGSACIFPFSLAWKPVSIGGVIAVPVHRLFVVAWL